MKLNILKVDPFYNILAVIRSFHTNNQSQMENIDSVLLTIPSFSIGIGMKKVNPFISLEGMEWIYLLHSYPSIEGRNGHSFLP